MSQRAKLSIEEKLKIVRMYLAGEVSMNELARTLRVNWFTVAAWVRNYEMEGAETFLPHRNHTYSPAAKEQAAKEYPSGGQRPVRHLQKTQDPGQKNTSDVEQGV